MNASKYITSLALLLLVPLGEQVFASQWIERAAKVNRPGAPQHLNNLPGESSDITYNETGNNWGTISQVTDAYGVPKSVTDYDWLCRPTEIKTGYETLTPDYTNPLQTSVSSDAGYTETPGSMALETWFPGISRLGQALR